MNTTATPRTGAAPNWPHLRRRAGRWLVLAAVAVAAVVIAAPFFLLVLNTFKTGADYSTNGPLAWPEAFSLDAIRAYLDRINFPLALWNSILSSTVVAFVGAGIGFMAAYAIGIGRVKGSGVLVATFLLATMLPHESLIYPLFYGAQATGTFNSIWSIVIVFSVLQAAFATYVLSSVISTVPKELLEAAALDGASRSQILWRIVFPIMHPTLAVLVVFFFVWTWNEFYIPLVLLSDPSAQTIPIALATLRGQHSLDLTVINAGSMLSLLPTLIFFLFFQRTLSRGVTAGALK